MATDAVRDAADNIMGSNGSPANGNIRTAPREYFSVPQEPQHQPQSQNQTPRPQPPSISYVWATNDSVFSRDIDRWITGDTGSPNHNGVHPNRFGTLQRDTLAPTASMESNGFWMIAAMILPLIRNSTAYRNWRCSASTVLNTVELFLGQIIGYCGRMRRILRNLTSEQGTTDLFACLMDVVLVIYAMGFLVLSFYQASAFQRF